MVLQHGNAFDAHAEGKAGIFFGVDTTIVQYVGVHHSSTTDFYPAALLTYGTAFAAADQARNINLCAGLSEWEKRGTEAYFGFLTKQLFGKVVQCIFKVRKAHLLVYVKAFYLMEDAVCSGRNSLVANRI